MDSLGIIGVHGRPAAESGAGTTYEQRMTRFVLSRVLEFTGRTIDEVINDPVVRNEVTGYFRLARSVFGRCESLGEPGRPGEGGKTLL